MGESILDGHNKLQYYQGYTPRMNKTWLCATLVFIFLPFFKRSTFVGSAWSFGFFIPATTANDLNFEGFTIPDLIHYIYFPILILEKEPVFPFLMFSAKQGNYWYHFYNVFGMTRSLTGDWTRDLPHSSQHYTTRLSRRR